MRLPIGARLGPYQLLGPLGAGGMGEVFKAQDTRLNRTVAIKILSEQFAADPDRRERFEREARAVAALNHPNICDLYDVGDAPNLWSGSGRTDSVHFLVMEYLEGHTLADRLIQGPLPTSELLRYAIELADALDHAHRTGLIHRDVKPANVMLTRAGAKLLDFGLSKLLPTLDLITLPTVALGTPPLTVDGALLGTFPYMAPEQLAGREADARSDIFAFGAMVFEMATGQRAFDGATAATLSGAILHTDPPPVSALQPLAPLALDRFVARCLAKDPDDRWQTARDVMLELKYIAEHASSPMAGRTVDRKLGLIATAALSVAAIVGLVFAVAYVRRPPSEESTLRLAFSPPDGLMLSDVEAGGPVTISPDGTRLAFVATGSDGRQLLWTRSLDSLTAQVLPRTDGAAYPFWSADSQFIGFFAQGKLKKIQASGGPPQIVCDARQPRGGTWNANGIIIFSSGAGFELSRVSAGGGAVTRLPIDPSNEERYWPSFLPDGLHFMYFGRPQKPGIFVTSFDAGNAPRFLRTGVGVGFASGHLLTLVGSARGSETGTLMAQPFDSTRFEISGEASPVAEQVTYRSGTARGAFSVSENGRLIYGTFNRPAAQLTWFDRSGTELGNVGGNIAYSHPALSIDGKTIAAERIDPETQTPDLWLIDTARDVASRFTSDPALDFMPVWSPDSSKIIFTSARGTPPNLYQKSASGEGLEELFVKSSFNTHPTDWSRDGRYVVYALLHPQTQWDLWLQPMFGAETDRKPVPFLRTDFNEHLAQFSPDGRWLAYSSDESGTNEVYVRAFPVAGVKWQISSNGGTAPRWRGDGRELFYVAADRRLMTVTVKSGPTFEASAPITLFKTRMANPDAARFDTNYAVTRNGQRFLIDTTVDESNAAPATIVINWPAGLSRR